MTLRCRTLLAALCACAVPLAAQADAPADGAATHELWLNPGFYAYHFQKNRNLNNNASGFGAEYRCSPESAFTAGVYRNSERDTSRYLAWYWRPLALGPARFGAILGAVDGYPAPARATGFPPCCPPPASSTGGSA